jgi:hypothetical protein
MAGARILAESNRIRDYGKEIPRKAADLGLFDKESIVDNDDVTVGESGQLFPQNFRVVRKNAMTVYQQLHSEWSVADRDG